MERDAEPYVRERPPKRKEMWQTLLAQAQCSDEKKKACVMETYCMEMCLLLDIIANLNVNCYTVVPKYV